MFKALGWVILGSVQAPLKPKTEHDMEVLNRQIQATDDETCQLRIGDFGLRIDSFLCSGYFLERR